MLAECPISTHARPSQHLTPDSVLTEFDDLKASYAHMLLVFGQCIKKKGNLSDVRSFLRIVLDDEEFLNCESPDDVLKRLINQMHLYKISPVEQTVKHYFQDDEDDICRVLTSYNQQKDSFLSNTRVVNFQPTGQMHDLPKDKCEVQFIITKVTAKRKTLQQIESLARRAFGACYNQLSEMKRYLPGPDQEVISWTIPKMYAVDTILWVKEELAWLKEQDVEEVKVERLNLSSCFRVNCT